MLQYQYDRWLFKTVTGAVESGWAHDTSPMRALETKTFSTGYWRWQHRLLKDSVRQFGFPSLFITISPAEWNFPYPFWFKERQKKISADPRHLPYECTVSIMHTLEQLSRGYIIGTNNGRWKKHLLSDTRSPNNKNLLNYFYRFEFQKRGTPHIHMLVWLRSCKNLDSKRFSATAPTDHSWIAHLVRKLQGSSKPHPSLLVRHLPTDFQRDVIKFQYSHDDYNRNTRAYVDSILGVTNSHMDVQCTDGRDMLLQYATSYTKMKDHDLLYDSILRDVSGYDITNKYMETMDVNEPEMVSSLSNISISSTGGLTKKFFVPWPEQAAQNRSVVQYCARSSHKSGLSLIEFLRNYKTSTAIATPYKRERLVLLE